MTKELITYEYADEATGLTCRYTQVYLPDVDMGHWSCVILRPNGDVLDVMQSVGGPWPGKITQAQCQTRLTESLKFNRADWQAQGWVKGHD